MYQVFAVRQVCEMYLANLKGVFLAYVDIFSKMLEKAYDTVDRQCYVADAKSVWSWKKIVESRAEF